MDTFLLTMLLVFVSVAGARDQVLVARLSDASDRAAPLLFVAIVCAGLSAAALGFAGSAIAHILPTRAGTMLVAFALVAAAIELAWPVKVRAMKEPTRSLGAIGFVLLVKQMVDGPRFIIFAFAAAAHFAPAAAIGGALGGAMALAIGWFVGERKLARLPFSILRPLLGACLFVAGLLIGLNARFVIW
ncbi:hypothetical protein [Erythrobacter sp. YT30]|uniref:hypothetical protein n=1 Tax=Erythrobacter sp. YT30 TaxID=1735012 RepID=UPI00076C44BD|nr:hypothetical protein [Erythrobacter sp. YT30]KWV92385.1 hypothetical protein AUC45_12260 [Erythrobacter sp. YT30]